MLPNALKATPSPVFTKIISTGSYLPEKILTNDDLSKFVDTSDEWIRSRSGIQSRHIAADGEETSDLAVMAAKRALDGAGLAATDIDLIVVATTTPDVVFPSTACIVQDKLGAKTPLHLTYKPCVLALCMRWRLSTKWSLAARTKTCW